MTAAGQAANRAPTPSSLADVLDLVLDKGIVIDAYIRLSAIGIEVLTLDARIVIASVDTYLRFAEAVNRLDIQPRRQPKGLPGLAHEAIEGVAEDKTKSALEGVVSKAHKVASSLRGDDDKPEEPAPARRSGGRRTTARDDPTK